MREPVCSIDDFRDLAQGAAENHFNLVATPAGVPADLAEAAQGLADRAMSRVESPDKVAETLAQTRDGETLLNEAVERLGEDRQWRGAGGDGDDAMFTSYKALQLMLGVTAMQVDIEARLESLADDHRKSLEDDAHSL